MPLPGLTAILSKSYQNFEPTQLHNTSIVINGEDFMGLLSAGSIFAFGGEYLECMLKARKVLDAFRDCSVTPIFVFPGLKLFQGNSLKSRLIKRSLTISEYVERKGDFSTDACGSPLMCPRQDLIEVLALTRTPCIVVPHRVIQSSCALASFLDCPVAGTTSDYFIMTSKNSIRGHSIPQHALKFISLNHFDTTPLVGKTSSECPTEYRFLSAHVFRPEASDLHNVQPILRPLLAILYGTEVVPFTRLPNSVHSMYPKDESMHPKERRFKALVQWLSQYSLNIPKPLEEVSACYAGNDKAGFFREMREALPLYVYDPQEGENLAGELNIPLPAKFSEGNNGDTLEDFDSFIKNQNSEMPEVNDLFDLLRGNQEQTENFLADWPPRLVGALKRSLFAPSLLAAVYGDGCLLKQRIEDPNIPLSVHEASLPIRVMHYRLLAGLERRLGRLEKLIGLKPLAKEYVRRGDKLVTYEIPVEPLVVNLDTQQTDDVLSTFFHSSLGDNASEPEWLFAFSMTLALFRNYCQTRGDIYIDQSPIILATTLCAVLTANEMKSVDMKLCEHYSERASCIESEITKEIGESASAVRPYRLDLVHEYTEIQLIYSSLKSLVNLIDSLMHLSQESQNFHFLPMWVVFPSGRLVHWLATHIESQAPTKRMHTVTRYWLPRLYRRKDDTSVAAKELTQMAQHFQYLIKTSSTIDVHLSPINYEVKEICLPGRLQKQVGPLLHGTLPHDQIVSTQRQLTPLVSCPTTLSDRTNVSRVPTCALKPYPSRPPPNRGRGSRGRSASSYSARLLERLEAAEKLQKS
ncbi:unnamed protein product [Calicophoron daubneyi]|uniref:Uncharacterized protein n=1 Tax=Calicophoron daubneyi TaxID=300641 RepID=A0AAV2TTJ2_CALDB